MVSAITIVVAAVLYVLISGLIQAPGGTPIGSAFALGPPSARTCTAGQVTAHVCATAGDQTFTLPITESTISLGSILFELKAASGGVFTNPSPGSFSVVTVVGAEVASYVEPAGPGFAMSSSWTHYGGANTASTPIATTMSLVVDTGVAAASWSQGQGNFIIGHGAGTYSGSTWSQVLP